MRNSDSAQKKMYIDMVDDAFCVFQRNVIFGGWCALLGTYFFGGVGIRFGVFEQWKRGDPVFWELWDIR